MIQTDTIIINSTLTPVYVLTYYDGIKEEVDVNNNTIYLWYDESATFEIWLKITSKSQLLIAKYLSNSIGIRDVIECSSVGLYKRSFDNYKELHKYKELDDVGTIDLPENELLGQDVVGMLHAGLRVNTTFVSQGYSSLSLNSATFKQFYSANMVETKFTSANDAVFLDFEPLAA